MTCDKNTGCVSQPRRAPHSWLVPVGWRTAGAARKPTRSGAVGQGRWAAERAIMPAKRRALTACRASCAPAGRAEPTAMEADGPPPPAVAGHAGGFDPAKKTIAELKAWLTEHGEENQVRRGCSAGLLATGAACASTCAKSMHSGDIVCVWSADRMPLHIAGLGPQCAQGQEDRLCGRRAHAAGAVLMHCSPCACSLPMLLGLEPELVACFDRLVCCLLRLPACQTCCSARARSYRPNSAWHVACLC